MKQLLNELKRRNVFRASAAYAVVAWVVGQAAGLVLPAFEAPDWVLKAVIVLLGLGLPLVIFLAWVYELTPEGLRKTEAGENAAGQQTGGGRTIDSIIILALVIAVLVMTMGRVDWQPMVTGNLSTMAGGNVAEQVRHVAVVPLVNVSTGTEAALLANGFTRLIEDELRSSAAFRVIGNSSAARIREAGLETSSMASRFGIDVIVQGSLRRDDGRIVIALQLVDASSGKEQWHADFEAQEKELHELVSRAMQALYAELGIRNGKFDSIELIELSGAELELWLKVLATIDSQDTNLIQEGRAAATRLVESAPGFGPARAALATLTLHASEQSGSPDYSQASKDVRLMLVEALGASPKSFHVQLWRADIESRLDVWRGRSEDFERISRNFQSALEQYPDDSALLVAYVNHLARWGEYAMATQQARKVLQLDPISVSSIGVLIRSLISAGRFNDAESVLEERVEILPASTQSQLSGEISLAKGNLEAAANSMQAASPDEAAIRSLVRIEMSRDDKTAARNWLKLWPENSRSLYRIIWEAAIDEGVLPAFELARGKELTPDPETAAMLGRLALQAGNPEAAVEYFRVHSSNWADDLGPLRGSYAWLNAPWYAAALNATGADEAARRILDRHLAGIIAVEPTLAKADRNLYLAANLAVRERHADALKALEGAEANGFGAGWGVLEIPVPLGDVVLFRKLPQNERYSALLQRLAQSPLRG